MKKKITILIIALPIGIVVLLYFSLRPTEVPISEISWDSAPEKIAISDVERSSQTGLLLTRLSDGKEQFFPGNWDITFEKMGNIFVYGSENNEADRKIFRINSQDKIAEISIKKSLGNITNIAQNSTGSYITIELFKNDISSICIAELNEDKKLNCENLFIKSRVESIWNPKNEHQVLIREGSGDTAKIHTIDAWETDGYIPYVPENKEFNELNDHFKQKEDSGRNTIHQVFNLALIKNEKKYSLLHVPLNSSLSYFSDFNHLILKHDDSIEVREINSNKKALLYTMPNVENKNIHFKALPGKLSNL